MTQRVKVPVILGLQGIQAMAPTFSEVPHSYQPVIPGKTTVDGVLAGVSLGDPALAGVTVMVDVPDEDCVNGQLDNAKVKARYPDHFLVRGGHFG